MLEELLKIATDSKHVLDLFLKHGNDVNSLVGDSFIRKSCSLTSLRMHTQAQRRSPFDKGPGQAEDLLT